MQQQKIITGQNEEDIWQQVAADINANPDLLQYNALLREAQKQAALNIDIDLGGGFESGYATTQFITPLNIKDFHLTLHKQGLLQEAGKIFGLQDIAIGHPEMDKKYIIRSNEEQKLKAVLTDAVINSILLLPEDVKVHTVSKEDDAGEEQPFLELLIEDGITDVSELRKMYTALMRLRDTIDATRTVQ